MKKALALVVALPLVWACENPYLERMRQALPEGPEAGSVVPEFEAERLDGGLGTLAEHRGRVVVLNAWATWCTPCLREMPRLQALHERFAGRGLSVIGVSIDRRKSPRELREFLTRRGITYENWRAPKRRLMEAFEWGPGVPRTLLVDRGGLVRGFWIGAVDPLEPEHASLIVELLSDSLPEASLPLY